MPYRRLPNSTPAILRLFTTAQATYHNTPNAADRAIPADLWLKLDDTAPASLASSFQKEASDVARTQAAQAPLTNALSLSAARLTMFCSHFHQVLDLGIARGDFAAGARSYYARDLHATALPSLASYQEVGEIAAAIVKGEADRQTAEGANYRPMARPSAAEVSAARATFTTARQQAQQAEANTNREQEEVSAIYAQAQELAADICDEVEHFYRKDPSASSRRAKSRQWGVVYIYDKNEPIDAGDTTGQVTEAAPNQNSPGNNPASGSSTAEGSAPSDP